MSAPRSPAPVLQAIAPADSGGLRIGILVLSYNCARTLPGVLARIPAAVWENVAEVAIFDNQSEDDSYQVALDERDRRGPAKLSVHRNSSNLGYGGNQKAGYRYFIERGYDVAVMLHGDGQYAPELLADIYRGIVAGGYDAVFGSRVRSEYGGPLAGGMPLYKFVGNRLLSIVQNRLLGTRLSEFHCGYRAYRLAALAQIDLTNLTDQFHFDTQIIVKLHHHGCRIQEVPIPTHYGDETCNVDGLRYAADVLGAVARYRLAVTLSLPYPDYLRPGPIRPDARR